MRGLLCLIPALYICCAGLAEELSKLGAFENCTDMSIPGMVRVSFGIYNTEEEVDQILTLMPKAMEAVKKVTQNGLKVRPEIAAY